MDGKIDYLVRVVKAGGRHLLKKHNSFTRGNVLPSTMMRYSPHQVEFTTSEHQSPTLPSIQHNAGWKFGNNITKNLPRSFTNDSNDEAMLCETNSHRASDQHTVGGLYYKTTKQPIRINDLVIRLREKEDMNGNLEKLDKYDIFDGPWRIVELPKR